MGSLFKTERAAPAPTNVPKPQPPAPMPDTDSAAAREAARRRQMQIMSRGGRTATILSAPEERERPYRATSL